MTRIARSPRRGTIGPQFVGHEHARCKALLLAAHGLIGDVEPPLGEEILHVAVAEGEAEIEPNRVLDDHGAGNWWRE